MDIAIASGKGGTGKTLIATNLAWHLVNFGTEVTYMDLDVEAPNGHLFLTAHEQRTKRFSLPVPVVSEGRCTGCGDCQRACQFNALIVLGSGEAMLFPELCHSCGTCSLVCREQAITEVPRELGTISWGWSGILHRVQLISGCLDVGEPRAAPLIGAIVANAPRAGLVIRDCPPGTSCNVVEAINGADHVVLVTEPTPFGLHDLRIALTVCDTMNLPYSVLINRADVGDDSVLSFLRERNVPLIAEIPFDHKLSTNYAKGRLSINESPALVGALDAIVSHLNIVPLRAEVDS